MHRDFKLLASLRRALPPRRTSRLFGLRDRPSPEGDGRPKRKYTDQNVLVSFELPHTTHAETHSRCTHTPRWTEGQREACLGVATCVLSYSALRSLRIQVNLPSFLARRAVGECVSQRAVGTDGDTGRHHSLAEIVATRSSRDHSIGRRVSKSPRRASPLPATASPRPN
jgi:hypothetical protein